jgi:mycofactocin system creatininase family protein
VTPSAARALGEWSWTEVDDVAGQLLVAVPVGSCEQHGPHLSLATDSLVASALCDALATRRGDVTVAPLVGVGASGEHEGFAGTLSVGTEALAGYLTELVRSARSWARGVVVVSGHGGNLDALDAVAATAEHEGDALCTFLPIVRGGDAHAGRTETSMMLALHPSTVRHNDLVPGAIEPLDALYPSLRAHGVAAVSPNGVLGDPRSASDAEGRAVLAELADDLCTAVERRFGAPTDRVTGVTR